jgi:hypothetical protein
LINDPSEEELYTIKSDLLLADRDDSGGRGTVENSCCISGIRGCLDAKTSDNESTTSNRTTIQFSESTIEINHENYDINRDDEKSSSSLRLLYLYLLLFVS